MLAHPVQVGVSCGAGAIVLRWFGYRVHSPSPITDAFGFFDATFSMNFINMNDGDTIVRWLFGYRFETVLLDNSSGLEKAMRPWLVSLNYTPVPDFEPQGSAGSLGGDALYRDFVRWHPQTWTDGTLYATKWYGDSGGMQSIQAQRTVYDKTTGQVELHARWADTADPGFDPDAYHTADVQIMMWVEILVNHL